MFYPDYIKSKNLYRKTQKALDTLNAIKYINQTTDLQLEKQSIETKVHLRNAIDEIKRFMDNIDNDL